ncbi:MAG: TolC family protein [bacterium]|jgi:outer membrane protein TolC|nr:TolC family protein [candidate division KSB1 bacterium]MDH7559692.1 TolC family protein [bacterium]
MARVGVVVATLCVLAAAGGLAAQQAGRPFTLEDCVALALEKNAGVRKAELGVDLAAATTLGTWSGLLPHVNASFASGRFIQGDRIRKMDVPVGFDPQTGQVIYEQREIVQKGVERNSHYARLSVAQNLFDWGRSVNLLQQARSRQQAAEQALIAAQQAVVLDVYTKYFALLKATKLLEVYREALQSAEEQLKRTQSMFELGAVAQGDVYKARVTVGEAKINVITQENEVRAAMGNLNVAMGRDPDAELAVVEVEASETPFAHTREQVLEMALQNNPELRELRQSLEAARLGVRAAKLAYLPTFALGLTYSRDNEFFDKVYSKDLKRDYYLSLGMQVELNLFRGFADKAAVEREAASYRTVQEEHADKLRQLALRVNQAFLYLEALQEIARINRDNLLAAEEDLRLAEERYRVGSGTLLEINDARVAVTRAKQIVVGAKYDSQVARATLEALMGTLGKASQGS